METPGIRQIGLSTFADTRGELVVIDKPCIPFKVQRVFYIRDCAPGTVRGGHAHKKCHQMLIAVNGKIEIQINHGRKIELDDTFHVGLYIPPGVHVDITMMTLAACLLVLASEPYDLNDYIFDEDENAHA